MPIANMVMLNSIFCLLISHPYFIQISHSLDYFTNCTFSPNTTQNSPFETNLQSLLSTLSYNALATGFYNSSLGRNPNQVYALYLCRADITAQRCAECVYQAHTHILEQCPTQIKAVIWYDECMVRFSNAPVFGKMVDFPGNVAWNPVIVPENETKMFIETLNETVNELVIRVTKSVIKFGTKESNVTSTQKVYTLGQCTPDLNADDCGRCLRIAIPQLPFMQLGGKAMLPSCSIRFEVTPFYGNSVNQSFLLPVNSTTSTKQKGKRSRHVAIAIAIPSVVAVLVLCGTCLCFYKKKGNEHPPDLGEIITVESLQFDFKTIRTATANFSEDNKLGQGGFGVVYKGMLQNGQEIAVKRLSTSSGQGSKELKTEVLLVARLQHNNLVKLLGFCLRREEKLLVYELLPNSSLDKVLLDPTKELSLDWETRYKIIAGIARGLLYLHEDSRLKIIHRDLIKSSNILLDENMNPKIADFGLARLVGADQTQADTNRIVGTYGYMAPEYAMTGRFSVKSGVYSFGIIILEIVSGHKCNSTAFPFHAESLMQRAWRLWNIDEALDLVDIRLGYSYSREEAMRCIHIGLLCIQEDANKRPTMAPLVSALNGHPVDLAAPAPPHLVATTSDGSGVSTSTTFSGDRNITEIYPR